MREIDVDIFTEAVRELRDYWIVVEGKKDKHALRELGMKNIIALSGKPLNKVVESVKNKNIKEVVIMTDFDDEGKSLFMKLKSLFQIHKIKTNTRIRKVFMGFGKNRIEEFNKIDASLIRCLNINYKRGDYYGKVSSYFNKIYNKSSHKSERYSGKTGRHRCGFWSDGGSSRF